MRIDRVGAVQREREAVLAFCRSLSDEDWQAPSGCSGWSVQDVLAHMTATVHGVFTPWMVKLMRSRDIERDNDADVAARRGRSPAEVLAEYETWSGRVPALLRVGQLPPLSAVPVRVAELGRHPLALLASAFVFDHHTHLRHDLAAPLGRALPESDPDRMACVVEWMMALLPRTPGERLAFVDRPLLLTLHGDGGGTWGVIPRGDGRVKVRPGPSLAAAAHITGAAAEFPLWATRRRPWRELDVKVDGDDTYATRFLDALQII